MRITVFIIVLFLGNVQNILAQQWVENGHLEIIRIDFDLERELDFNIISLNSQAQLNEDFALKQGEINRILRSIAYTHQKPAHTIRINWELIASYQVFRQEKGNFKSDIFIKPMAPQGELNLYEFNSASYILPTLQSFRLRIFKEDSSLVYLKYFNQNPISVGSVGQIAHFSIWHQRWAKGWYMKIDQFDFQYNSKDLSFEQWFQYTNDYKAANYLVNKLLDNYRQLQQTPQEPYSFLIKSLRQVNYLKNLYQMPFYRLTILENKDPDKLERKMNILSTLLGLNIDKYTSFFKESVSEKSIPIDRLVFAYLEEDQNLMHLQQGYGRIYDQLFKRLAKSNYPANLSFKNIGFFESIGIDSAKGKMQILSFENRLYLKSIANINSLILNQQFAEALYTIDNLENFRAYADALKSTDNFEQYKARAAYGMYNSYIDVVDKAIKIKNTNLAVQYLKKAGVVQESYSKQIITNSLAEKKLKQLLAVCYSDYNKMIEQNRYLEAAAKRDTIRELISDFSFNESIGIQFEGVEVMLDQSIILKNQTLNK